MPSRDEGLNCRITRIKCSNYPNLFRARRAFLYRNKGMSLCLRDDSDWRMERIRVMRVVIRVIRQFELSPRRIEALN